MLLKPSSPISPAKIIVCGIGGAGNNAINSMIESGLIKGVHFIAINTDAQVLDLVSTDAESIIIGSDYTKGLGAGGDPAVGKQAAEDSVDIINEALVGADMVFIAAGMGGGTGTGAAPVIAGIAKQLGALTIGVVTKPFPFEMKKKMEIAEKGIAELESKVDALIVMNNEKILEIYGDDTSFPEAMRKADQVLLNAVKSISDIITITGHINVDFADVKAIMHDAGSALMGFGDSAAKEGRAREASLRAINSPLLDYSIHGAKGVLITMKASSNMGIKEVDEAVSVIQENIDSNANLKYGVILDDSLGDTFSVTVLATGFDFKDKPKASFFSSNEQNTNFSHSNSQITSQNHPGFTPKHESSNSSNNINQRSTEPTNHNQHSQSNEPFSTRESLYPSNNQTPFANKSSKSSDDGDLDVPAFLRRRNNS